jgi:hypothetical protein
VVVWRALPKGGLDGEREGGEGLREVRGTLTAQAGPEGGCPTGVRRAVTAERERGRGGFEG